MDDHIKPYRFTAGGHESHWDSIRRLAAEAGWEIGVVNDSAVERLRACTTPVEASRATCTRLEFMARLVSAEHAA